jgi:hypothetical protein
MSRQGELYLCDRDAAWPRVRIYDIPADTLIAAVDVGVPPYDIALVQQECAGVPGLPPESEHPEPEGTDAVSILICPNPARPNAAIRLEAPGGTHPAPVRIHIHDVAGRLVRSLDAGICGPGRHEVVWDGTDDRGNTVAGGVYYCRITNSPDATARLVLVR